MPTLTASSASTATGVSVPDERYEIRSSYVEYGPDHVDSRGRRRADLGIAHRPPADDEVWHPSESGLAPRAGDDPETAEAKRRYLREKHVRERLEQPPGAPSVRCRRLPSASPIPDDGDLDEDTPSYFPRS